MQYTLRFRSVWQNFDYITEGVKFTLFVSLAGVAIGIILGIIAAVCKSSRHKILSFLATAYIELFRNTPLLVQLWLFYFGLAQIGIDMTALQCGVLALGINAGAYIGEVVRAGMEAIDKQTLEAAVSLGFRPWLTLRKIQLPLALRAVMPAIGNNVIQILLASSLLSNLGINELTNQALRLSSKTFRSFETFIVTAVLYMVIAFLYSAVIGLIKKLAFRGSLH